MSNKRNKRNSTLKSSILILLLIAILLVVSTYAWFTANQTVTISTLDVHVEASNGLQISTDGTTWKTIISNDDILNKAYTGNVNQLPVSMEPVSTIGEIDTTAGSATQGFMKMYYGTAEANKTTGIYELTATQSIEKAGTGENLAEGEETPKFIAFDVFLKVDQDSKLYLTKTSNVTFKAETQDKGLKNAARVAFCVEGHATADQQASEFIGLSGAKSFGSADSSTYIWEPNYEAHTTEARIHANDTYGMATIDTSKPVPYYGVSKVITDGIELANTYTAGEYFTEVTPNYTTTTTQATATNNTEIFSLTAGVTKVRIYMWVEGQDIDCENSASGSDISFNVQFTLLDK